MLIDFVFAMLIIIACIKGYQKGVVIAIFSIISYIIGLAAALKLSVAVANQLKSSFSVSAKWLPFVSFAIVFFSVVLLVRWGGKLIEKTLQMALLGLINRIGGMILYAMLYTIILSIFLFYLGKLQFLPASTIGASQTYHFIHPWGPKAIEGFGKIIPIFKDMFTELENFFDGLSNKISH